MTPTSAVRVEERRVTSELEGIAMLLVQGVRAIQNTLEPQQKGNAGAGAGGSTLLVADLDTL